MMAGSEPQKREKSRVLAAMPSGAEKVGAGREHICTLARQEQSTVPGSGLLSTRNTGSYWSRSAEAREMIRGLSFKERL